MTIDKKLAEKLVKTLKKKGIFVACAESMTGGLLAKTITDIPGASEVFDRGIVTYSNNSKISELDVAPETIESFGAISSQTAREMVQGLSLFSGCKLCIAVTGNAGPKPAEGKAVGLYYIGVSFEGSVNVLEVQSSCRTRNTIRIDACNTMLQILYSFVK